MLRGRCSIVVLFVLMFALGNKAAMGQTVPLSGKIISHSLTFTATASNRYTASVFTLPATGSFVLTQFCSSTGNGFMILSDSTFGFIATSFAAGTRSCISFSPGIALSKSSQILCSEQPAFSPSSDTCSCSISGVLGT